MADQPLNQPLNEPGQPAGMGSTASAPGGGNHQLGERYRQALASLENPTLQQQLAVLRDVLGSDRALWPALRHLIEQPGFGAVRNDPSAAMRQVRRAAWLQDLATWCNQASLARVEAFLDGLLQLPNSSASAAVPEDQDPEPSPPPPSQPPFPQPPPSQRHDGNPPNGSGTQAPSAPATQPASGSGSSSASSSDAMVRRLRAEGLEASQRGDHQRAIALFSEALQWNSSKASLYLQRASVQAVAGNFGAAIEDFNAVLKRKPGHLEALAQRGKALAAQGRLEEAKQNWQEASRQGHPEARRWLAKQRKAEVRRLRDQGIAARDSDNPQQAIDRFTAALQIDGGDAELYRLRSELLARVGNLPMALEDLSEALRLEPENAELMAMKGKILSAMDDLDRARESWIAAANRGHPDAIEWLANDCLRRALEAEDNKNYHEVIDLITNGIRYTWENPQAYWLRGRAFQCLQDYESARRDFSRVLELESDNKEALVQRGHVLTALDRRQEAEADWQKAEEIGNSGVPMGRHARKPVFPSTAILAGSLIVILFSTWLVYGYMTFELTAFAVGGWVICILVLSLLFD